MTRAKDRLTILLPQRFYVHQQVSRGDRHVYASRTRFIPDMLLPFFECRAWPLAENKDAKMRSPSSVRIDVAARMRSMWR
jgi:DNA helicase-2/ATP-dependent DNA helicase PcrA